MRRMVALALGVLVQAVLIAAPTGYHITGEVKIGGDGGWDYLTMDSAARRLYVSHATHVAVVDVDSGKVVGDIPDTPGVHGIAIAPELNRGFVSNGRGNNVTIFDLKTLKAIGQVPTGENPDSIRYDAGSGRVFTFNGRSNNSTAIDAKTGKVAGTIALGGKPEFSVADGRGTVFTQHRGRRRNRRYRRGKADGHGASVRSAPFHGPSGLAIDIKNRKLFSVCGNRMITISRSRYG